MHVTVCHQQIQLCHPSLSLRMTSSTVHTVQNYSFIENHAFKKQISSSFYYNESTSQDDTIWYQREILGDKILETVSIIA